MNSNEQVEHKINLLLQKMFYDFNEQNLPIEKHIQNIGWLSLYADLIATRNLIAPIKYIPPIDIINISGRLKKMLIIKIGPGLKMNSLPFPFNEANIWMDKICKKELLNFYEKNLEALILYYKTISKLGERLNQNTGALDGIVEQLSYWLWEIKERK